MTSASDADIVKKLKKGKLPALEELIDKYSRYTAAIVGNILRGRSEDCEEVVSDVFFALWENRLNLRPESLKSYIGTVARNKAFNLIRKDKEVLPLEDDILIFGEDIAEEAEKKDISARLIAALDTLEPKHKELFIRHYYYGFSIAEAANDMGINPSTAKTWLCRGREALRKVLCEADFLD